MKDSYAFDSKFDGYLLGAGSTIVAPDNRLTVKPVLPEGTVEPLESVYYINGIMTPVERNFSDMQSLANTGCRVTGIHVSTSGLVTDLAQCVRDKLKKESSRAIETLVMVIKDHLNENKKLHLIAHSRGALIVSRSLCLVQSWLNESGRKADEEFTALSIETYGGASAFFPDGPCYVHVHNRFDPVPMFFGVGPAARIVHPRYHAGKSARRIPFLQCRLPVRRPLFSRPLGVAFARIIDETIHGPGEIYFSYRQTFDEMYNNRRESKRGNLTE